ncbi:unnamed protein product [Rhizoctonia solani]|uniref:ABC transporter domain-containing protein n=1 Tax=Rhizoctonia solani TaxID=456999 RepID=A0A8H3AZX8_9AGAM|nr:unnamed protein product [Rhizoctonia solani]
MSHLDTADRQRPATANSDPATAVASRAPSENIELSEVEKKHHGGEHDGVNVKDAEAQFNALSRRLTRQSTKHHEQSDGDVEKQETFNLLDYLRTTSGQQDEAGFAKKHVGVTFENLRVTGVGGVKIYVRTFPDAVKEFFLSPYYIAKSLVAGPGGAPKTILDSFNGAVRPGEMVLVLGRPGSGCSSFLKTIANQRGSFLSVDGNVQYAGIDAKEFGKRYAGQAAYNMEDDIHYPILTVAQTLQFALKLKSPGRLLPEQTRAQLNDEVLDTLLSMLNITHTRNTVVGNEFVRGVSGGERKRVSIAEMMSTRACVCSWDNSTRGLDASTALDYAKSLRVMTDIFKLTTFVSLYQAGEGIYDQFDKVLLIDEGRQVYFGPAQEARDYMLHGANARAITIYAKERKDNKELNERLKQRKAAGRKGQDDDSTSGALTKSTKAFTWENLDYTVPVPGGTRQLLNKVFGYVKPGTLTALMGASGAGKTTLLDVLAGRKTIGVIHGDILIGGAPTGIAFQRGTAYCEQLDVHESTATVREALRFSAYLRQPYEVSKEEKDAYVEEVIALLEMEDIADAMIGQPGFGLGVEARKRVTIGVELAAKPQLLLFLDEPTSGLDGQSAYNIVRFLKKLAAGGQAILCTIHQPNALLFEQFDNLLLLQRGGECVYFGPIGKDSQHLVKYLDERGAHCPPDANPAEYVLEAIGAGSRDRVGPTLAAGGQAILCTIHQPNALLFEQFDNLLLLQRGGECVYFGPIGKDSQHLVKYLDERGAHCPPDANPAEYVLEAIGAGSRDRVGPTDWAELWRQSSNFQDVKREIHHIKEEAAKHPPEVDPKANDQYATPFMHQLQVVSERTLTAFWRQPDYGFTRLFSHGAIALLTSLTFLQLGNSTQELQYRVFGIFMASVMPAIIISQVEPMFIMARMIFIRESSSRMYSQIVFALGQLMAEMPYSVLCAVVYFLLFYFPAGFNPASDRAGYHFFMILVTEMFSVTLGQMLAALTPSVYIASLLNPFILVTFSLFCGVTIPKAAMPKFWRAWLYHLDPFTRLISGLVSTELHGLPITCTSIEFSVFQPPSGQTCVQWAGDFVNATVGYLENPNATSDCQYCPYSVGDDFYAGLNISFDTRWRDLGIMIAFTVFNIIVTLVGSKLFKFARR